MRSKIGLGHQKLFDEGKNIYIVAMVKGDDNVYDETSEPRILLTTEFKEAALACYEKVSEYILLEEPEQNLYCEEKYESPVVIRINKYAEDEMIRG